MFLFSALLTSAWGADQAVLAMVMRAQWDFDRVEMQPFPAVQDTTRCVLSHAELLAVSRPSELPLLYFRKGYCELLGARLSGRRGDYQQAAQDFAQALAAWPTRAQDALRAPEPVSSGLQVLSAIARLEAGASFAEVKPAFEDAQRRMACPDTVMPQRICQDLLRTGRFWQGWIALRENDLSTAGMIFREFPDLAWSYLAEGRRAEQARRYPEAVQSLAKVAEAWSLDQRYPKPGLLRILGPAPDLAEATAELGAAQYLAGRYTDAITTLDAAVRTRPEDAYSIFVRGLAKDAAGNLQGALNDYQAASRTAFAHPEQPFSAGQAHLFRGVWHFRRKAWVQAENEFASALNADPGPASRADAGAWRQWAAVNSGSCQIAGRELQTAMAAASDLFPKTEAQKALAACGEQPRNLSQNQ